MRIKIKILMISSSLVLLAIFNVLSINAYAIDSTGSESADQLIDESNGIFPNAVVVDTRFPTSPQESRRLHGLDNNASYAVPSSLASGAPSSQDSMTRAESAAANQDKTVNTQNTSKTASAQTISTTSATIASGNWSFELNDSTLKEVVLAIIESNHIVFGTGSIAEGNNTLQVTASGFEDGNRLNLNLTTLGSVNLYMLSLTTSSDSAVGDYRAFSADGQYWTGGVKGTKSMPQS